MTMNHRSIFGAVITAALLGTGCSSAVKQPEISLASLSVGGIGLRGATLVAHVDIRNPNSFDLETDSITYELEAADANDPNRWARVSQGVVSERIKVDDHGRTTVEIPIEFNYSSLSGAMRSIVDRGTFNYRIRGNAFVREPLRRSVPFSKTGNLSLSGAR
jgi:LEA14-like dessication related protein